jgi:hypothetical protein
VQQLARPDQLSQIQVRFDKDVIISGANFALRNDTSDTFISTTGTTISYDQGNTTGTWDFSGLTTPLEPGFYSFILFGNSIFGADGSGNLDGDGDGVADALVERPVYVAIPGDANLNGQVDVLGDGAILVENLGTQVGASWGTADFNGDGDVDVIDANGGDASVLVNNLGESVVPPMSAGAFAVPVSTTAFNDEHDADSLSYPSPATPEELELAGEQDVDNVFASEWFV